MTLLTPRLADLRDVFVARGAEPAQAFLLERGAIDPVRLHIGDERAKQAGLPTPDLAHFLHYADRCALLH